MADDAPSLPIPAADAVPLDGLPAFTRFAVGALGRWNQSRVGQRLIRGFVGQVSYRWMMAATSNRLVVEGEEHVVGLAPPRGVLMVSNHRSFFDLYVLTCVLGSRTPFVRRLHYPVRSRFFYTNPLGVAINFAMAGGAMWPPMFGGFDRHGRNAAGIAALARTLESPGTLVGVHPEGTRSHGPDPRDLLPAKGGAGRIVAAAHPEVLVLPCFVTGMSNDLAREVTSNFRSADRRGPPLRVRFGAPTPVGDLDRSGTPREVSRRLLDLVRALAPPPPDPR